MRSVITDTVYGSEDIGNMEVEAANHRSWSKCWWSNKNPVLPSYFIGLLQFRSAVHRRCVESVSELSPVCEVRVGDLYM